MSRSFLTAALAAVTACALAMPALAIDETKPSVSCYGLAFRDKAGDTSRSHPLFAGESGQDNLDLIDGFFKYDSAKGDEATTVNIRVKDLDKSVPPGSNSVQWQAEWVGASGEITWVRAVTDFSGLVTYDYGGQTPAGVTTANTRQGGTTGAFFEGPDGIVQIVIPPSVEPKGSTLKGITFYGYEPVQALPGAAPTPMKGGQLYEQDSASAGKHQFTVGSDCPAAAPAEPAPEPQPSPPAPVQVKDEPLPVKLLTRSVTAKRRLTLRLRASQPVTKLALRLRKGKKVFGKGSLRRLSGTKKVKLKVSRRLKKGTYLFDMVGTDAEGARRFATAKLKVR